MHKSEIAPALLVAGILLLVGCTSPGATASSSTASAAVAGSSGGAPDVGLDFAKVQECLTAAGITAPAGGSFAPPSGGFGPLPSGAVPSGGPGGPGGPGGGLGQLNDPTVQAALKACGITIPAGSPAP